MTLDELGKSRALNANGNQHSSIAFMFARLPPVCPSAAIRLRPDSRMN
jgi:hypothetical protein